MRSLIVPMSALSTSLVECGCGNEMLSFMDMCGDCMNDETNVIEMGQRVLISTRRSFKYGN